MVTFESSSICFHLITEGSTDRALILALIQEMIKERHFRVINLSSTQRQKTGKNSIVKNVSILNKKLHHGFSKGADIVVICVDNDNDTENEGKGLELKRRIAILYEDFLKKNLYYKKKPCLVSAVPVKTMDYWMKAISISNPSDCERIINITNIPKERIKEETYGVKCVFRGRFVEKKAINKKVKQIHSTRSLEKLRCLPSFQDFEKQLRDCIENLSDPYKDL